MTSTKPYLNGLVDREAELPTRCDNGWTRTLLVLASMWVGIAAYARSCEAVTRCTSTFGTIACTPFTLGGALSACSMRACASKSQGSTNLNYMSTILNEELNQNGVSGGTVDIVDIVDSTASTTSAAHSAAHSEAHHSPLLRNTKWQARAYKSASALQPSSTKEAKLRHIIESKRSGDCEPGQWRHGAVCTAIATTPLGLTETAMDKAQVTSLEARACGVWSSSVRRRCASCSRQYFTLQSSLQDEAARWESTYQRLQLRGGSRGPAGTLMTRCIALRQEGTASIVATMLLSYGLLQQRMPPPDTISDVLQAIGQLSSYGCNSLVRVGTTVGLTGVSVQLANIGSVNDVEDSLKMVNHADALRTSLIMKEILSLFPVTTNTNGLPTHSIWEGTGLSTPHRAQYDACHLGSIAEPLYLPQAWHVQKLLYGARGVDSNDAFDGQTYGSLMYLRRLLCLLSYDSQPIEQPNSQPNDRVLGLFGKQVGSALIDSSIAMCVRSMGEALNAGLDTTYGMTPSNTQSTNEVLSSGLGRVHPIRNAAGDHAVGALMNTTRFEASPMLTRDAVLANWKRSSVVVVDLEAEDLLQRETQYTIEEEGEPSDVFDDVMRSPTSQEYTSSALVTVNNLNHLNHLNYLNYGHASFPQSAGSVTTAQCGALVGFVAPTSMDRAAFQARFTKRMLVRLEGLFDSLRTQMLQTVNQMSTVFKDVSLIEYAFLNVRVSIPGATQSDSATFGGRVSSVSGTVDNTDAYESQWQTDVQNGAFPTHVGVLLNLLDSARATKRLLLDHALDDEVKDPC